ncbi:FAD-binding and (Fe-S)-binding domain-containing protein [Allostella humosa]|nr:FAD-binding and (Fe-S)-binding domain-containing protein [Stella humosa]
MAAANPTAAKPKVGDARLAERLRRETRGEVLFDAASRGRYSTDASIYQIEPLGVLVAREPDDIAAAIQIAREEGVPLLPRGAGTSQCGQTVGEALVVDVSKHLNRLVEVDVENRRATVQPGIVLDHLNKLLRPHKLFFPVDVSPANRATIGGMTGNNSCGSRSIRYGNMVHNVHAVDAILADGSAHHFGPVPGNLADVAGDQRLTDLVQRMRALHGREADEIDRRIPKLLRKVGGYNIDLINPAGHNMASLLVGSEGTLGFFTQVHLDLQKIPSHRTLGVCHFPTFYAAMDATRHIVDLGPSAVELVDRTLIDLSREIAMFRPTVDRFVKGEPQAILLVEFAGEDREDCVRRLADLVTLTADLGFPDSVVEAVEPAFQAAVWEVRKAGLNIMMSMKGEGKPVSFIEDCAVPLADLAEYTRRLDEVFARHGTSGTWYAHASVGTLHVRPILNLKEEGGAKKMRAIAEEAFAMVREYKGSHSGEHGDGLVRSEFHRPMFGDRIVRAFEEVKEAFDPTGLFNPGKIVHPSKMDDRSLFRWKPGYKALPVATGLDWSDWGGLLAAVEMCNNNGECRKSDPGVMCPSYRATMDEQHVTRGRANTLRLAVTGQLGNGSVADPAVKEALDLCLSCKGCKRECPTGVDMARMKIEFQHQWNKANGVPWRERVVAHLPRYARVAAMLAPVLNLRDRIPGLAALSERMLGFAADRPLPKWRRDRFDAKGADGDAQGAGPEVALFVDSFTAAFEPENARAAQRLLVAAGYRVTTISAEDGSGRALCCGRTYLAAGMVDEARAEAVRALKPLAAAARRGVPIVGLEPSCLFTFRDEHLVLGLGEDAKAVAAKSVMFEEFVAAERAAGRFNPALRPSTEAAVLHGHCHQRAFGTVGAVEAMLKLVPGLKLSTIDAGCCGMAGAFGYQKEHADVSRRVAEVGPLPAVRAAPADAILVAAGTSCRHQFADLASRTAIHPVRVLANHLAG